MACTDCPNNNWKMVVTKKDEHGFLDTNRHGSVCARADRELSSNAAKLSFDIRVGSFATREEAADARDAWLGTKTEENVPDETIALYRGVETACNGHAVGEMDVCHAYGNSLLERLQGTGQSFVVLLRFTFPDLYVDRKTGFVILNRVLQHDDVPAGLELSPREPLRVFCDAPVSLLEGGIKSDSVRWFPLATVVPDYRGLLVWRSHGDYRVADDLASLFGYRSNDDSTTYVFDPDLNAEQAPLRDHLVAARALNDTTGRKPLKIGSSRGERSAARKRVKTEATRLLPRIQDFALSRHRLASFWSYVSEQDPNFDQTYSTGDYKYWKELPGYAFRFQPDAVSGLVDFTPIHDPWLVLSASRLWWIIPETDNSAEFHLYHHEPCASPTAIAQHKQLFTSLMPGFRSS